MRIVLSGGEKGSYRNQLVGNGVKRIAINVSQLAVPTKKEFNFEVYQGADLYLYSTGQDDDDKEKVKLDLEKYDNFIRHYHPQLTLVIGRPDYDGAWLGDKYVPIWNDPDDLERLAYLCEKFGRVAIADKAINARSIPRIRQLQQRWKASLVALTSKVDTIEALEWDVCVVTSWTSVVRYGETQVWDGHALRRFPAAQKEQARKRLRAAISRLGVDVDAVLEDDVDEVAKLAIRSWLEYEMHTFKQTSAAYDPWKGSDDEEEFEGDTGQIVTIAPETDSGAIPVSPSTSIAIATPEARHETEKVLLPVIGVQEVIGNQVEIDPNTGDTVETTGDPVNIMVRSKGTLRQCDSCYLAPKCPRFREHAECAYEIPIELKTKEQMQAVLTAILEMQTDRVIFAKFAEELEGQGMDPALSTEMDRLFRLVKDMKEIVDTRDVFKVSVEAKGNSGMLGRIFGSPQAAPPKPLPAPVRELMESYPVQHADDIQDAEVVVDN